jgi:thiol-disulfide isomerase/thioredoxin
MAGDVRAPELETPLGWLNTDRPLRFSGELKGQVVVLDFWTYCCINCIHILPDLSFLEHKYTDGPVTFIGVHSAKFSNEASRETIRQAILRYEIHHPVVIDDGMKNWRAYAARSWPTVVVVDPRGYVIGNVAGEGHRETLDQMIGQALAQAKANGTLADAPLTLRREANVRATSGLAFPGKVFADAESGRLYVADSNHNRVLIAEPPAETGSARVVRVIGSGRIGQDDGPAEQATFNHPQGLAVAHGRLYLADTENHLIREIDLDSFEVRTVVGTGEMCNDRAGVLCAGARQTKRRNLHSAQVPHHAA